MQATLQSVQVRALFYAAEIYTIKLSQCYRLPRDVSRGLGHSRPSLGTWAAQMTPVLVPKPQRSGCTGACEPGLSMKICLLGLLHVLRLSGNHGLMRYARQDIPGFWLPAGKGALQDSRCSAPCGLLQL